jgi:hypothetical protein
VGVGDSLEAPYRLTAPIPAGRWGLVGDGKIITSCDVQFDVLWRSATGDVTIASFSHHFDPAAGPNSFAPVPFDGQADGVAAPAAVGDHLVLRFSITSTHPPNTTQFVPNADGSIDGGRIPALILPTR